MLHLLSSCLVRISSLLGASIGSWGRLQIRCWPVCVHCLFAVYKCGYKKGSDLSYVLTVYLSTRSLSLRTSFLHCSSLWSRHPMAALLLLTQLFTLVSGSFRPIADTLKTRNPSKGKLENSSIFYLKIASNLRNTNHKDRGSLMGSSNSLSGKRNSNLYKLPLQFVSNAKPIDIIQGKLLVVDIFIWVICHSIYHLHAPDRHNRHEEAIEEFKALQCAF